MNTETRRQWCAGGALFLVVNVIRAVQGDWAFLLWLDGLSMASVAVALLLNARGRSMRGMPR